jgi:hypothetical protein
VEAAKGYAYPLLPSLIHPLISASGLATSTTATMGSIFFREFQKVFPGREVLNNLGYCYLQLARQEMEAERAYFYCLQLGGLKPPPLGGSFSRFFVSLEA